MSAFTLILSRKAIQDIIQATPEAVTQAYTNALSEAQKAVFSRGLTGTLFNGPRAEYARMTDALAGIIKDLAKARDARDTETQAQAVRDIMAGAGKSGAAYNDILKVLIQFVDAADLAAIVEIDVKAGGKQPRVSKRFVLNPGGADSDRVRAYSAARARFIAPSVTSD